MPGIMAGLLLCKGPLLSDENFSHPRTGNMENVALKLPLVCSYKNVFVDIMYDIYLT